MVRIAIVSAMREELHALLRDVTVVRRECVAGRDFVHATLAGTPLVLVLAGIGKVAAAATTALLLDRFAVDAVLFTGVAGGLAAEVGVGDVLVATELLQHDLDASPLFPRYEVPLTGRARFATDPAWSARLAEAAQAVLATPPAALRRLGRDAPRLHRGLVVSGDRFVATAGESEGLRAALPEALGVDMESAAAAQVCADFGRPCAVLRSVSDRADDGAHIDFERYVAEVAAELTRDIVQRALA